jgi:hypothetical protein
MSALMHENESRINGEKRLLETEKADLLLLQEQVKK